MILEVAVVSIAILHSLAPDHYVPISAIGRSRKWPLKRTLLFALIAATMHVSFSILIGVLAYLGLDLVGVAESVEKKLPLALIVFGILYAIVSLFKPHKHVYTATTTSLLFIIGLSPCLPLIPIMLSARSVEQMLVLSVLFSASTVGTVLFLTYLTYRTIKPPELHGKEDFLSGVIIAITGALAHFFAKKIKNVNIKNPEAAFV